MDGNGIFTCLCGKECQTEGSFTNHQRTCSSTKRKLASALGKARDAVKEKRQRLANTIASRSQNLVAIASASIQAIATTAPISSLATSGTEEQDDSINQSTAQVTFTTLSD